MPPVQVVVITMLLWLARRARPVTLALAVYKAWLRLPPRHRQQLVLAARRNGPRVASSLVRRARPRP